MSKGVKRVLSVAAAIAIPYFAPLIAGSTALAGVAGTLGTTATSALVGAGLGAAKGAVLGEDIGRSALMGGLSGGVSGYMQAPPTAAGTGLAPPTAASAAPTAGSQYALTGTGGQGLQLGTGAPGLSFGGQTAAGTFGGTAAGTAGSYGLEGSFAGGPVDYSLTSAPTYTGTAAGGTATPTSMGGSATGVDYSIASAGTTASGAPKTFSEVLSQTGDAIKAKFTDPKNLADLTLRAAGQLAGSALAGSGLSPEEEALLAQQTEELRQLQQTNEGLFRQRLEQAQNLMGDARYFDPEYFGLQSARRAQTQGAVAKRAGLRGLTGERRESEGRRYDIESGRRTGTAYDVGFQSAIGPRLQTQQAGLSAMPGYQSFQTPAIDAQLRGASVARQRRAEDREGIADLFGPLYK